VEPQTPIAEGEIRLTPARAQPSSSLSSYPTLCSRAPEFSLDGTKIPKRSGGSISFEGAGRGRPAESINDPFQLIPFNGWGPIKDWWLRPWMPQWMNDVAVAEPTVCRVKCSVVSPCRSRSTVLMVSSRPPPTNRSSTTKPNPPWTARPFKISSHPYAPPTPRLALIGETDTPGCSATPHRR
jgi:hypothetical protein